MYPMSENAPARISPSINEKWKELLWDEFCAPYFNELRNFLTGEKAKHTVYPPGRFIFNAFDLTPPDRVRVVILGQDPYHGPGQAHGLCFSVPEGITPPPSLKNIFKELNDDLGIPPSLHGSLEKWALQGVLLLNATLTVRAGNAGSHQNRGWEKFTDTAIRLLSDNYPGIVFMLWGRYARQKVHLVDSSRHLVLEAAHPSPFSAYNGFFGCRHFSRANSFLEGLGKEPVNWVL
jgi:uracil-DNA glycosylase